MWRTCSTQGQARPAIQVALVELPDGACLGETTSRNKPGKYLDDIVISPAVRLPLAHLCITHKLTDIFVLRGVDVNPDELHPAQYVWLGAGIHAPRDRYLYSHDGTCSPKVLNINCMDGSIDCAAIQA